MGGKFSLSGEWVNACPESFREEIRKHIDHPPGTAGSYAIYGFEDSQDFYDPDFTCLEDGSAIDRHLSSEEKQRRRKFAQAWGVYAESLVCCWLLERGLPIIEKDWRPKGGGKAKTGEIDIITQKGNRMIFIEVKARCGHHSDPWEAIDSKKIARLCKGADIFLKNQRLTFEYQFDVALITGNYLDFELEYIEDAFLAPLRTIH